MGEKLNDELPLGEGYFGYLAGVLDTPSKLVVCSVICRLVATRAISLPCRMPGLILVWEKQGGVWSIWK